MNKSGNRTSTPGSAELQSLHSVLLTTLCVQAGLDPASFSEALQWDVINLLRMPINKINAEMIHTSLLSKSSPSLAIPTHWLLTLFLGYWMTVQCLECSSRCRVSRIIDKPQGPDPWIRMTGLSKQPWQTLTSTSTVSQVYEEKMHLGRARREVFSLNLFPLHKKLQQGGRREHGSLCLIHRKLCSSKSQLIRVLE